MRERNFLLVVLVLLLAALLPACATVSSPPESPVMPVHRAEAGSYAEQPPYMDPEHVSPRPAGAGETTTTYSSRNTVVEVVGSGERAQLWASVLTAYNRNFQYVAVNDPSLGEYVFLNAPDLGIKSERIHISQKLAHKLRRFQANPQAGEGLFEVCPTQAGISSNFLRRLGDQGWEKVQTTARTSTEFNPPCPGKHGCVQSSWVSARTQWDFFGPGVDLVDAWDPHKPTGSVASKIWTDERSGHGTRVQVVRYNGMANPRAYQTALNRAFHELMTVRHQYTTGTCLYQLHL